MANELRQKTVLAFAWTAFGRFGKQGLQFVISIFLARILAPEQFGLIAMLSIFIAVSEIFVNGGFGAALVREKEVTNRDYSTVFWINISIAFFVYGILFVFSPQVAHFYNQPLLEPLLKVMALNLVINSFGIVPSTMFARELNLAPFVKINILTMTFSGAVAIVLAFNDCGVWSLVWQQLVASSLRTISYWIANSWRPNFIFCVKSFKNLFSYGFNIFISEFLDIFFRDIYLLIIGKFFSPISLGFYSRAKSLQQLPAGNIQAIIGRVSYLSLLKIQDDTPKLLKKYREVVQLTAMISAPLLAGLFVIIESFTTVILTNKWLPCVPYVKILCFSGFFIPLQILSLNLMKIRKRSDLYLLQSIIDKVFIIFVLFFTVKHGVLAMIYGQVVLAVTTYLISILMSGRLISYSVVSHIADIMPYALLSISMAVCVQISGSFIPSASLKLVLLPFLGGAIYFGLCWVLQVKALDVAFALFGRPQWIRNKR